MTVDGGLPGNREAPNVSGSPMTVTRLVSAFAAPTHLPVEIPEVAAAIREMGFVDHIVFKPFDEDPEHLLGMLVRWTSRYAYGGEVTHAAVCYNQNVCPYEQRLICCKELVHILDPKPFTVSTKEGVSDLIDRLLGKLIVDEITILDAKATFDRAGTYQALAVLFPQGYRDNFITEIDAHNMSIGRISEILELPSAYVQLVLSDEWEGLKQSIVIY